MRAPGHPACLCCLALHHLLSSDRPVAAAVSLTKAQQNFVIPVKGSSGETTYVWTGDMWQSARDGIKAHDRQCECSSSLSSSSEA